MNGAISYRTRVGKGVLLATILGSGVAILDSTVVNVALPVLGRDLGASLTGLQWTVDGYLLTLSALLLVGGSLGDRWGRRIVFVVGFAWFALASLACALAPSIWGLVAARAFQGVGAALLMPGSLAVIRAVFNEADRGQAIGAWAGWGAVAAAVGPLLGGWLIEAFSWRAVFLINLPIAAVGIWVALKFIPETRGEGGKVDLAGALAVTLGLGGVIGALIEGSRLGWTHPFIVTSIIVGVLALFAFIVIERRRASPMLPLGIFRTRQFTGANLTTLAVYFAFGGTMFLLVIQLQRVLGYSPLAAGAALTPLTLLLLLLSPSVGRLTRTVGFRLPMTVGPFVVAVGMALLVRVEPGASYVDGVLPGVMGLSLGMAITVAPLTTAVLEAAEDRYAGVASGVNNAVARTAGLLAVAVLPVVGGMGAADPNGPACTFAQGFPTTMWASAALASAGGVAAWFTVSGSPRGP